MVRNIARYRNIYVFIIVLATIGFLSGFFYFKVQTQDMKNNIKETINIQDDLKSGFNNILKSGKKSLIILGSGCLIITSVFNVGKVFYEPFSIGFIFSFLCTYSVKMAFIYVVLYQFISFLFLLVLIRISFTIAIDVLKILLLRERKIIKHLKMMVMKYFIVAFLLLMYELIISIFSANINAYLMTFI